MDLKSIKNLISIFENSQLGEMEVESGENGESLRVVLKRNSASASASCVGCRSCGGSRSRAFSAT